VSGSAIRVLIVDDYAPSRYARVTLLRRAGFDVLEATNGAEALARAVESRPHVVILDIALPVLNGYEVCRRLKADPALAGVQVLYLTGAHRDAVDHARGLEAGADGYLVDPVAPEVLLATVRSLTRAGVAEVAAGSAALQWQLTVDSISDAVCLLDRNGRILRHNAMLARLGGQGDDLVGRDAREVLDVILGGAGWDRGPGLPDAPNTLELEAGERTWQLITDIVRDPEGVAVGAVCVLRDVSERRRMDDMRVALLQLEQQARREAEAANQAKDEFLAVLSHELRTPLTAMLGWTSMLASGRLDPEAAAHAIEVVDRNTRLQARIIEDLLDVSRIISGKMTLHVEDVALGPALEVAVDSMRTTAAARMITLTTRLDESLGIVSGDAGRLQQVFTNLLSNAVKFTPPGGHVTVSAGRRADEVVVTVSDTGRGIPADLLPFIFEPFRQAEGAQRRTHTGLGLGLAIVRHVAELHGGTVEVASEGPGKGATFSVRLPAGTGQMSLSGREHAAASAPGASLHGLRLLLVEDDADTREVVGALLQEVGVQVTAVDGAEAALKAITALEPDVLVSDVGMAGRDGYDLIRSVRRLPTGRAGQVPAIALSAFARESDRRAALEAGYDRHLAKPVELEALVAAVADVVCARRR
jgi:signal transduction histidine kinase/AmiR/NasT family two-component response regulator